MECSLAGSRKLGETLEEVMRSWNCKLKGQHFQDQVLHSQHLLLGVSVVGNVDELSNFRRVDLFVFPLIELS